MAIPLFLAMTAAEFTNAPKKPSHIAWMACHFSPYGTGLTNLPKALPEGALLILNDRTPVCGHDPELVCQTLFDTVQRNRCSGILLDLQRPGCGQTERIIEKVLTLPCSVAVSDLYAGSYNCPVFLSAPPVHKLLSVHLDPWKDREIWLETAHCGCAVSVTKKGSTFAPHSAEKADYPFRDENLHCHYRIDTAPEHIRFTLQRTKTDMEALLGEAESLGITRAVGLYQELG